MATISQKEAKDLFLPVIEKEGKVYKKSTIVDARPAEEGELVVTEIDGEEETRKKAKKGDMVITNPDGEEYIVDKKKFESRYDPVDEPSKLEGNKRYEAKGYAKALEFNHEDFDVESPFYFTAAWDEKMLIKDGDMIVTTLPDKNEVYRIEKKSFSNTYKLCKNFNAKEMKGF